MKTKTLTLLTGAACLASLISLTSCGNSIKDADFKSYKTEITRDKFYELIGNLESKEDVKGYTQTYYDASETEVSGTLSYSNIDIEESTYKFDSENKKYYRLETNIESTSGVAGTYDSENKEEIQYQMNGEDIVKIDLVDNTYATYYWFDFDPVEVNLNYTFNKTCAFQYTGFGEGDEMKYYLDDNVYTAVYTKTSTNEESLESFTYSLSNEIKAVLQFYLTDNTFTVRAQVDMTGTSKTVKDGNTFEMKMTSKNVTIIEYDFTTPSISTLDLAKYKEDFNSYK